MNIIIVGCTLLGCRIADGLAYMGHDISILDIKKENFKILSDEFDGLTFTGDPMDPAVLETAGIEDCDALAAVTEDDNMNIIVAQLARNKYNIEKIVTKIVDPSREAVFEDFGLDTVCPTKVTAAGISAMLLGEPCSGTVQFRNHRAEFVTRTDKHLVGKKLYQIPVFPGEMVYGVIDKNNNITLAVDPELEIKEDDSIIFTSIVD